jgi:hypothetical protein
MASLPEGAIGEMKALQEEEQQLLQKKSAAQVILSLFVISNRNMSKFRVKFA